MFGVFQTYYQTTLLQSQSPSNVSWIGSTQDFLRLFVGTIAGPFFDLCYLRTLLVTGTLSVFGMMMTSLCEEYWQSFLAQGVVTGVGVGCLFLPNVAVVSQYFTTTRSTVFGIAASGRGIGMSLFCCSVKVF
ncbi:hypothetical protein BJ878DRAFT_113587 [Calycina marina]|uniref:Major facilitator superfamily (MFS) profile domain-containing protein n=1 Tax=Calycina marina TaxID=1763456 RepID=A0A9P7Z264_9HELO|nr:hypothetical protein BJ878DRAFT_113587 [Calycina marina]